MIPAIITSNYQNAHSIQRGLYASNLKTLIYKTDFEVKNHYQFLYHDGFFIHIEDPTMVHVHFCEHFSRLVENKNIFLLIQSENLAIVNTFRERLSMPIYVSPFSFRNVAGQFLHLKDDGLGHPLVCEYNGLELKLDSSLRTLVVNNELAMPLSNKEFQILQFMFNHRGKLITKLDLLEFVWDRNITTSSGTIEVHMSRLRKKFRSHIQKDPIQTVPCAGYVFC